MERLETIHLYKIEMTLSYRLKQLIKIKRKPGIFQAQ
jgi:hypothetical protein